MKLGLPFFNTYVTNALPGETIPLSVTSTSANVAFNNAASARNYDVMVINAGSKIAFIAFGNSSSLTATVPGTNGTIYATPVPAGAIMTFQKNTDAQQNNYVAAICGGADTTTLYFTSIQGS